MSASVPAGLMPYLRRGVKPDRSGQRSVGNWGSQAVVNRGNLEILPGIPGL
jgi:hypothetical protein